MGYYSGALSEEQLAAALAVGDAEWRAALYRGAPPHGLGLPADERALIAAIGCCAEAQSERFAELLADLPGGTRPFVMQAILFGLASSKEPLSGDLLLRAVNRCHGAPKRPLGTSLVALIEVHAKGDVPRQALELLSWYALKAKRQMSNDGLASVNTRDQEDEWQLPDHRDGFKYQGSPDANGLSTVRGIAVRAIGSAVARRPERLELFLPTLKELAGDRSTSVRARLAQACCDIYRAHPETAMRLVLRLTDGSGLKVREEWFRDAILSTDGVRNFLTHLNPADYETIASVVERCLASKALKAMTTAARAAGTAAGSSRAAEDVCERCLLDNLETREAAAGGLSHAVRNGSRSGYVVKRLSSLFFDKDASTAESATGFLHFVRPDKLREAPELIRAFLASPVFARNARRYAMLLSSAVSGTPDLAYGLALVLLRAGDDRTGAAVAKQVIERGVDPSIVAKCKELLHADRERMVDELRTPWEEPDFTAPAETLPPVPRWGERYPPAPDVPPPAPKKSAARVARARKDVARPNGRPEGKHLILVFLLLVAVGRLPPPQYLPYTRPSFAGSLAIAFASTLLVALYSYAGRVAPRWVDSWLARAAGILLVTALLFAWAWYGE